MRRYGSWLFVAVTLVHTGLAYAHRGHHDDTSQLACAQREVRQSCAYIMSQSQLYRGTCQLIANTQMCVRNKPILSLDTTQLAELEIDKHGVVINPESYLKQNWLAMSTQG